MKNTGPVFDHIGLWCTDVLESAKRFERAVGVQTQSGGRHEGQGTWNRLVGAGPGQYLELIGLDPEQSIRGSIATQAADLPDLTPCLLAYRSEDLETITDAARAAGCETPGPFSMQRLGTDGAVIEWRILFLTHRDHAFLPFFIDWQSTPHPSKHLGEGVNINGIALATPHPDRLSKLLGQLGLEVETRYAERAALIAEIQGPQGILGIQD
ncbi:MAG: VOC family protein [Pseudomonadota bacterium]